MCGIAGLVDFNNKININNQLIKKISEPNKYRGPDNFGSYIKHFNDYSIGFSHNRLSIIDLSQKGNQPMFSQSKRYLITFNGEIYNYKSLKKEIEKEHKFFSSSDTEVILNAIDLWGIDTCLEKIEGMFAFGLFDFKKKQLILVRDRFGEKPLYFSNNGGYISFSSDIRSFNYLPIEKTIDNHSLGYYFSEMCTPQKKTIWKEIKKVSPGTKMVFSKDKSVENQYWNLDYRRKIYLPMEKIVEKAEYLLMNSVEQQLNSDVDVGCFLSGGVDSSLIAVLASKVYHKKLKTFSVGFEEDKYSELYYAKTVANKIGSDHHEIIVNPKSLSSVNNLILEYGEPFSDVSQIPSYFISKFASQHVKVCLGGDGADELFGGYRTYNQAMRMQMWKDLKVSHKVIKFFRKALNLEKLNYLNGLICEDSSIIGSALYRNLGFNKDEINKLTKSREISIAMEKEHKNIVEWSKDYSNNIFDSILFSSIKTRLLNDYLVKTDRSSMYNSLELRNPFLDKNLQHFLSKLNFKSIMFQNKNKYIAKKILEKYFDSDFVNRTKQGFEMPIANLIRTQWREDVEEVLYSNNKLNPLNIKFVKELFVDHLNHKKDNSKKIWNLYVFNIWSSKQ